MPTNITPLTEIQHLYACLGEEGCEIGQIACKIERFGPDDVYKSPEHNPKKLTNRERLIGEVNDMIGVIRLLVIKGEIPMNWEDMNAQAAKAAKVEHYMKYAREIGTVMPLVTDGR